MPTVETGKAEQESIPFPIVGLGASAGGLEALTRIFSLLPAHTGMAFVVIQHLDPNHKSELTTLLAKAASIPVTEAEEGMLIHPDRAYVIPPGSFLAISQGVLRVTPRPDVAGPPLPVNYFLISLAEEAKGMAIGVILSGTGSDGTLGLAAIKKAGGLTFVQQVNSARNPGMPTSARALTHVDYELTPEDIAGKLVQIGKNQDNGPIQDIADLPATTEPGPDLGPVLAFLRSATGVDFSEYRDTTLKRRILRRMAMRKRENLAEYLTLLGEDRTEVDALYQDILINVTRFFRDTHVFDALKSRVYPDIHAGKSASDSVRIWVAGCATGEEVYSLAITLLEFQEERQVRPSIRIFGSDIDPVALEKARAGFYPDRLLTEVSPERLQRFFSKETGGYRIRKSIRDTCIFAKHDMTDDTPFSRMDLISCRNVLIYLSAPLQRRVLPIFHYALNPIGFLLMGSSESVGRNTDLFAELDSKAKIFAKKLTASRVPNIAFVSGRATAASGITRASLHHPTVAVFQATADRLLLRKYSPPGVLVNKDMDILQFRGRTGPFLEPPQGEATFNLARMAHESLFLPIRSAIRETSERGVTAIRPGLRILSAGKFREVDLEVHPIRHPDSPETCYLVLFTESQTTRPPAVEPEQLGDPAAEISQLRHELSDARDYLSGMREQYDAVNEEMKSSGEEMLSSNEELQSTNEELETAKEELQSTNEELTTLNEELHGRNLELGVLNGDLTNVLGSVRIPILMLGGDLRLRRFTSSAAKLFNLSTENVGSRISKLSLFLDSEMLERMVGKVIASATVSETDIQAPGGCWYRLQIHPYRAGDDQVDGVVLVLLDIDTAKRTQDWLRESAAYTSAIVATIRKPLLVLSTGEMRVQSANPAFYRAFGGSPEETVGRILYQIGNGQWDLPKLRTLMEEILFRDTPFEDYELDQETPGGGGRILLLNARRLKLTIEGGPQILLAIEDITARKRAEHDLKLFKFMCDRGIDPYYLMNREGRFIYVNQRAYTRLGYTEAELMALTVTDIDPSQAMDVYIAMFDKAQTGPISAFTSEHVTHAKDVFPVEYSVTGLNYGGQAYLLAVVRDISEQRMIAETLRISEQKLRISQKVEAVGKLAGGIAHDFNNNLTAIYGYSELCLSMVPPSGPLHDNLTQIHKAGKRAAILTRQLLAYSRKQIQSPKILNLNDTTAEMLAMLDRQLGERFKFIPILEPTLGQVHADPGEMEQVIFNLVVNARDALPEGGEIIMETKNVELDEHYAESHPLVIPGRYVLLAVSDVGCGMDSEVKARIFDPFFTTKEPGKGSGMGLSMVMGIVLQSGGHISVYSEPGHGATFKVYLPRVDAEVQKYDNLGSGSSATDSGTETVMLVEDEEPVRAFARKVLEMRGYKVLEAQDGKSALALLDNHPEPIHLLLTDVIMPGMNGRELAKRIQDARPEIGVVFMSGYTNDAILRHGFLEKGTHFVQKPYTPGQLSAVIRKALNAMPVVSGER